MTRKLILDTDGGVDDAQALLMLISNGKTPDAITTVFGNVGLDAATGKTHLAGVQAQRLRAPGQQHAWAVGPFDQGHEHGSRTQRRARGQQVGEFGLVPARAGGRPGAGASGQAKRCQQADDR